MRLLHRNVQRFRGGLVFKAHRLCVSLNSRLESNKEEERRGANRVLVLDAPPHPAEGGDRFEVLGFQVHRVDDLQWYRGGLVFEAHRLLCHSA